MPIQKIRQFEAIDALVNLIPRDLLRWRPHVFTDLPVEMKIVFWLQKAGRTIDYHTKIQNFEATDALVNLSSRDMLRWCTHVFTDLPVEMKNYFLTSESERNK